MSNIRFERVPGTLSTVVNDRRLDYNVVLELKVVEHPVASGIEAIPRVSLASASVPDGPGYTLSYIYRGEKHEQSGLRVQFGRLVAA